MCGCAPAGHYQRTSAADVRDYHDCIVQDVLRMLTTVMLAHCASITDAAAADCLFAEFDTLTISKEQAGERDPALAAAEGAIDRKRLQAVASALGKYLVRTGDTCICCDCAVALFAVAS